MTEEKDIDQLLKEFDASGDSGGTTTGTAPPTEGPSAVEHILTPEALVHSVSSLTKMLARKLDFPELAFTTDDEIDLTNALQPFADKLDLLIKYLPYLPLGLFTVGYSVRIISGIQRKKKDKQAKDLGNGKTPPTKEQAETAKKEADAAAAAKPTAGNDKERDSNEPPSN
jgi:hypothetical protein